MTLGSLFSGIGGIDLGFQRAGFEVAWQVEIDPFCRKVLTKHWPDVRRHDDVKTFPPKCDRCQSFAERFRCNAPDECDCPMCQGLCQCDDWSVDVIAGGFPCQDISNAGRGEGIKAGNRSGLWSEFHRIIRMVRPRYVVVENVAALLCRGMGRVLGDLAAIGFDAEWGLLPACAFGAPHTRERVFLIAHRNEVGRRGIRNGDECGNEVRSRFNAWKTAPRGQWRDVERWIGQAVETGVGIIPAAERGGMANGIPNRLDRIGGLGNAVVPQVAQWIAERIKESA